MIQDWQPLLFKEKLKILRYQKLREELGGEHIELQIKGYRDKERNDWIHIFPLSTKQRMVWLIDIMFVQSPSWASAQ